MWETLANFMHSPEVTALRKRHYELTGDYFSSWNWDEFGGLEDYLEELRQAVAKAEREAEQRQE